MVSQSHHTGSVIVSVIIVSVNVRAGGRTGSVIVSVIVNVGVGGCARARPRARARSASFCECDVCPGRVGCQAAVSSTRGSKQPQSRAAEMAAELNPWWPSNYPIDLSYETSDDEEPWEEEEEEWWEDGSSLSLSPAALLTPGVRTVPRLRTGTDRFRRCERHRQRHRDIVSVSVRGGAVRRRVTTD